MFDFLAKKFKKGIFLYHIFPYLQKLCDFSILCFYVEKIQRSSNGIVSIFKPLMYWISLQQFYVYSKTERTVNRFPIHILPFQHRQVSPIIHTPHQNSGLVIINEPTWTHHQIHHSSRFLYVGFFQGSLFIQSNCAYTQT